MLKNKIKNLPLVSVIINCHNGEKYLKKSIESILNQTYKKWEIIFFDNNSHDKSRLIIKKFNDRRIRYFKTHKTYPLYYARNLALKKTKGEYISFLDTDDWWIKKKLEVQVKIFSKDKSIDIQYSNLFIFNEKTKKKKIFSKKNLYNGKITQDLLNDFKMPILTTMIKKDMFKKIKFDNRYTIIGDFDFFVRASLISKIKSIQIPLAYYRIHNTNLTTKKIDLNIKELEIWIREHMRKINFKTFSFSNLKKLIQILKIKDKFNKGKKLSALKIMIQRPFFINKLKFLPLVFLKN